MTAADRYKLVAQLESSSGDHSYRVKWDMLHQELTCNCPRWRFTKERPRTCRHTDETRDHLAAEHLTVTDAIAIMSGSMNRGGDTMFPTRPDAVRSLWLQAATMTLDDFRAACGQLGAAATSLPAIPDWLGGRRAIILRD